MQNDVIRVAERPLHRQPDQYHGGRNGFRRSSGISSICSDGQGGPGAAADFDPDIISSGQVDSRCQLRGTFQQPLVAGKLQLTRANLNYGDFPNGLSNANGVIVFNGTRGNIQNLTAESGGGKIVMTGSAGYAAESFFLPGSADASGGARALSRRREHRGQCQPDPERVERGQPAGRDHHHPAHRLQSRAPISPPCWRNRASPSGRLRPQSGFLADMQLDVQIQMAPDVTFQSSLAENVQAEANLRLSGTALNPALLGRIVITQGQIVFFGTKFTIDQGAISFFNPVKIEPVLDIDLETKARGVDVILTVSGPLSKLNLTPRSDPPLQFSEIVALLATGTAPTSDPNVAVQQPADAHAELSADRRLGAAGPGARQSGRRTPAAILRSDQAAHRSHPAGRGE